jgi:hypothetical protein
MPQTDDATKWQDLAPDVSKVSTINLDKAPIKEEIARLKKLAGL